MLWPTHRFPPARLEARFRILYVGNDLGLIAALRGFLAKPDHKIVSCMDCGSAAFFIKGNPRDELLVFDLKLGSPRVLKPIPLRSLSHRKHLPIVVLTETESGGAEELAGNLGPDDMLSRKDLGGVARSVARLLRSARNEPVALD